MTEQSRLSFLDMQKAAESVPSLHHPSILLLDDDPLVLEFLANTLRGMDYPELTTATHASDALLQVKYNPSSAQVIVCDLSMPEMDGIAFLQALNEIPFRGSVILLSVASAREMHSVQRLLSGSGFTILGTLTKPAARAALRSLLETWPPLPKTLLAVPLACYSALDLRAANRHQQWLLHYQPQVDLSHRRARGYRSPDPLAPPAAWCGESGVVYRCGGEVRRGPCDDGVGRAERPGSAKGVAPCRVERPDVHQYLGGRAAHRSFICTAECPGRADFRDAEDCRHSN